MLAFVESLNIILAKEATVKEYRDLWNILPQKYKESEFASQFEKIQVYGADHFGFCIRLFMWTPDLIVKNEQLTLSGASVADAEFKKWLKTAVQEIAPTLEVTRITGENVYVMDEESGEIVLGG